MRNNPYRSSNVAAALCAATRAQRAGHCAPGHAALAAHTMAMLRAMAMQPGTVGALHTVGTLAAGTPASVHAGASSTAHTVAG